MTSFLELPVFKKNPWYANSNSIWMLSNLVLHRNLKTHFFPHCLEPEFLQKVSDMLTQVLVTSSFLKKPYSFKAKDLSPLDKQVIYEFFLPQQDFSRYRNGEVFIFEGTTPCFFTVNIEDHLKMNLIDTQENLEESWTQLLSYEQNLSKSLEFAFCQKFGFLTADHKKCGTGLVLQTFLHLPALIHLNKFDDQLQKMNKSFFNIQSLTGSLDDILGDLILVSNRQTLGISEEVLLKNTRRVTLELTLAEKSAREHLSAQESTLLKDKVGKAFGILRHASKLSLKEAYETLSLCKLGVELHWITGIEISALNALFFTIRKGCLQKQNPEIEKDELEKKRAEVMREKLKKMKFQG